jgi:hypothetical protein
VGDGLGDLLDGEAVADPDAQVRLDLLGASGRDQGGDGDEAAVAGGELGTGPHVAEQHLVGQVGELRGDVADQLLGRAGGGAGHGSVLLIAGASAGRGPS